MYVFTYTYACRSIYMDVDFVIVLFLIFKHAHDVVYPLQSTATQGNPQGLFFSPGEHQAARRHHLAPRRAYHFAGDLTWLY